MKIIRGDRVLATVKAGHLGEGDFAKFEVDSFCANGSLVDRQNNLYSINQYNFEIINKAQKIPTEPGLYTWEDRNMNSQSNELFDRAIYRFDGSRWSIPGSFEASRFVLEEINQRPLEYYLVRLTIER